VRQRCLPRAISGERRKSSEHLRNIFLAKQREFVESNLGHVRCSADREAVLCFDYPQRSFMCNLVTENLQKCAHRDPAAGIAATTRIVAPTTLPTGATIVGMEFEMSMSTSTHALSIPGIVHRGVHGQASIANRVPRAAEPMRTFGRAHRSSCLGTQITCALFYVL
jgi:hypothetical protein